MTNTNLALQLVETNYFEGNQVDFYKGNQDFYLTRNQIGKALGYKEPMKAIHKIHERHADRLNKFSTIVKLGIVEGKRTVTRNVITYSYRGLCEICRYSEQPNANQFMDWVWDVIENFQNNQGKKTAEQIINNVTIDNNDTLHQVLSRLNNLEERFNGLQQERTLNIQTISTLEKAIKLEKRQIHKNPLTEKRSRIYAELKNTLFHNEFNNPDTAETFNKAIDILKSTSISGIKAATNFIHNRKFNKEYNCLEWALLALGVGYTILHCDNVDIYRNKASECIFFHKEVDQKFCDEYLETDSLAEKQSFLHKNIISKLPKTAELNDKILSLHYFRTLDTTNKQVNILLQPTHMRVDESITLNEYLIMLDMAMKKIDNIIKK